MAGRPKQGIDYSGWSVDIFDGDKKIDKLLDAKGWKDIFMNGAMTTVQRQQGGWAAASVPVQ